MVHARGYGNIVLLLLLVLLPLTYALPFAGYILIFAIAVISLPTLYIVLTHYSTIEKDAKKMLLPFGLYILWLLFMLLNSNLTEGTVVRIIQMLGCLFAFVCGSLIKFSEGQIRAFRRIIQAILIVNIIDWFIAGMPLQRYSFIVPNTATYGSILFCWIMFLSIFKEKNLFDWIMLAVGIALLYFSTARASLAAVATFITISFLLNLRLNRKGHSVVFLHTVLIVAIVGFAMVILFYAESRYTPLGIKLNELSIKYFGKYLYSGRQIIWHELLEAIKERPFLGYGLNTLPSDIYDTHLSAHNTFLQVALQCGIVGLGLLGNILLTISRKVFNSRDPWYAVIGLASMISIILHECFEACLVQNMLVAGLQMWLMLGFMTNKTVVKGKSNE